jgi:hypothetical protein
MRQRKWLISVLMCMITAGAYAQVSGPFDGNTPNMAYCSVAGDACLSFDGVDDFVNLGDSPSLRLSGNIAVMAWVKLRPGSENRYMGIVGKMASARGFVLARHLSNKFVFWTGDGFGWTGLHSAETYTDSEWHHVTGMLKDGQSHVFVDGMLQKRDGSGLTIRDSGAYAHVGKQYSNVNDRYFSGLVDDVRFYNRGLSDQDVVVAMTSPAQAGAPGLAGYWRFDDLQGQGVTDASGNGNHGFLGDTPALDSADPAWASTVTFCQTQSQGNIFVNADTGHDTNSGRSPQQAFATIQRGINAANPGDTVIVAEGVYMGVGNKDLDYGGRAITVQSAQGPYNTIIDCQGSGRGIVFQNGEGPDSVFSGFSILNGNADRGAGIYCYLSSPVISGCIISGNNGLYCAGVYCRDNSAALIVDCVISNNTGTYAGGVRIVRSNAHLLNCVIADNMATDSGAGVRCDFGPAQPVIENCTITGNVSDVTGGGLWCAESSHPLVKNCIVWGNSAAAQGPQLTVSSQSMLTVAYSDIQGGQNAVYRAGNGQLIWDSGNIDANPNFVDPASSDYTLMSARGRYWAEHDIWIIDDVTSPCIDAGDPMDDVGQEPTPNGLHINMGAYGATEWASLSATGNGSLPLEGDVNGDGFIEMTDLFLLINDWLTQFASSAGAVILE